MEFVAYQPRVLRRGVSGLAEFETKDANQKIAKATLDAHAIENPVAGKATPILKSAREKARLEQLELADARAVIASSSAIVAAAAAPEAHPTTRKSRLYHYTRSDWQEYDSEVDMVTIFMEQHCSRELIKVDAFNLR